MDKCIKIYPAFNIIVLIELVNRDYLFLSDNKFAMRFYHTPRFLRYLYNRDAIWQMPGKSKTLYLTFDDGPTTELTYWILDILEEYNAKATFFCVGANVEKHPQIFKDIIFKGHSVGNHTFNHLNGWKTETGIYCDNILKASNLIDSHLFRPPYGKMKRSQIKLIKELNYKTVMWSILTYDFDKELDFDEAWKNILLHTTPGSILVFHDNIKAIENIKLLLPKTLEYFSSKGFNFEKIKESEI